MDLILVLLGLFGILVGLFGVVVPVLPGLSVVWLGTAGTLLLHRVDATSWTVAAVITVLFLLGSAATIVLPTRTGIQGGVSRRSFLLAATGGVVGFFVFPVVGFPIGALAGLLVGEKQRLGDWMAARNSTWRVLRAYGIGVIIEVVVGLTMAATWLATVVLRG